MRLPTPDQLAPEDRPVLAEFHRIGMDEDRELFERFPAAYLRDPTWAKASRGLGRMTKAEFDEFFEAYIALLMKYSHRAEDAPTGRAAPVHPALRPARRRGMTLEIPSRRAPVPSRSSPADAPVHRGLIWRSQPPALRRHGGHRDHGADAAHPAW